MIGEIIIAAIAAIPGTVAAIAAIRANKKSGENREVLASIQINVDGQLHEVKGELADMRLKLGVALVHIGALTDESPLTIETAPTEKQ